MTTAGEVITLKRVSQQSTAIAQSIWHILAYRRLDALLETAQTVPFDDSSRIIFFSDCHRGDNSQADAFVRNKALYLQALDYYYQYGFTYVEVGDGDELWDKWSFDDILRAHREVFERFHRFEVQNRLHIIVGNHDIQNGRHDRIVKDGIVAKESLLLRHRVTGQEIVVVHGHQGDFSNARMLLLSRFTRRSIFRRVPFVSNYRARRGEKLRRLGRIENRLTQWAAKRRQIVICGHTHRPVFTVNGGPPYYNAGSCLYPGYITGLEIQDGGIALVRWSMGPNGSGSIAEREQLVPFKKLRLPV